MAILHLLCSLLEHRLSLWVFLHSGLEVVFGECEHIGVALAAHVSCTSVATPWYS